MLYNIIAIIICLTLSPRFAHAAIDESIILRLQDDVDSNMRLIVFPDGRYFWGGVGNVQASGQGVIEMIGDTWHLKHKTALYTIVVNGDPTSDRGKATLKYLPFGTFHISDKTGN